MYMGDHIVSLLWDVSRGFLGVEALDHMLFVSATREGRVMMQEGIEPLHPRLCASFV